jgi:cell division septation protein DedD
MFAGPACQAVSRCRGGALLGCSGGVGAARSHVAGPKVRDDVQIRCVSRCPCGSVASRTTVWRSDLFVTAESNVGQLRASPARRPSANVLQKEDATQTQGEAMASNDESPSQFKIPEYTRDEPQLRPGPSTPGDYSTVQSARLRGRDLGILIFVAAALGLVILFVLVRDGRITDHLQGMENRLTRLAANEPAQPSDTQMRILETRVRDLEQAVALQPAAGAPPDTARLDQLDKQVAEIRAELDKLKQQVAATAKKPSAKAQPSPAPAAAAPPVATSGWVVQLLAAADQKDAKALADKARKHGYQVAIEQAKLNGRTFFRVLATGFGSQGQATEAAKRLQKDLALSEQPWVAERK